MRFAFIVFLLVASALVAEVRAETVLREHFNKTEEMCDRRRVICDVVQGTPKHFTEKPWADLFETCNNQLATCDFIEDVYTDVLGDEDADSDCRLTSIFCETINDMNEHFTYDAIIHGWRETCRIALDMVCFLQID